MLNPAISFYAINSPILNTCFITFLDPSLAALANEVEALRAALLQKEQQVASLTRPMPVPVHPPFTTSGLATTPGLVPTQTYVPQMITSGLPTTPGPVPSQMYVPQITTTGLVTTPGLVTTQTYVPQVVPAVTEGVVPNGTSTTRAVPAVSTLVTSPGDLGTNSYLGSPGRVHHHHYFTNTGGRGETCTIQ